MPEGPSLIILKEEVQQFKGKKIQSISGNAKIPLNEFKGKQIVDFMTWGKHFLIRFPGKTIRIHFLLFGSYRINETREAVPRLSLKFSNGQLNFYACSVKILEGDLDELYDWGADVMSEAWDEKRARARLKQDPQLIVADALLDQSIFSGVGNIIRNEVLYRIRVHPESVVNKLPARKITELVREARNYSFDFLLWKKAFVLKSQWLAHTKSNCVRCGGLIQKIYPGKTQRRSFFCKKCQVLYK